jgi:hypothetical protein
MSAFGVGTVTNGHGSYTYIISCKYPPDSKYTGEWKDVVGGWEVHLPHGRGKMEWSDGTKYTGDWKDGIYHGRGKLEYRNGDIYEGNWSNDKAEGTCVFRWANGDIYEGNWRNDKREGRGVMRWRNGNIYDGGWKNDEKEGRGVLTYAVSDAEIPPVGPAVFYNAKDKFDGGFKAGRRHGACTYTFFNGETFRCTFVEGWCHEFNLRQMAVQADPKAFQFASDSMVRFL